MTYIIFIIIVITMIVNFFKIGSAYLTHISNIIQGKFLRKIQLIYNS